MALETALSAVQTLFAAFQSSELKEMCSIFRYESKLAELQDTVTTIEAVLRDAETKQELSRQAQLWIHKLKDVVYDADDLFDKFLTLAKQKQLIKGGKASKKVRSFFSRKNPFKVAYDMFQGVKEIRRKLDATVKNHEQFGFKIKSEPIRRRREETCSYVYNKDGIIGRQDDVEKIVGHLLTDHKGQCDVSVLTIVGIGGLGKTALARLVFDDARVTSAFPLRLWTCVSDNDQDVLDVKDILGKILAATDEDHHGSTLEKLQSQVRAKLANSKYLLVLDDVWTERREQWRKLEEFLKGGQRGSWVVVTTRSHETARCVGSGLTQELQENGVTHELQGLTQENAWRLFNITAFGSEHPNPDDDLVKLGREIVEKCYGLPLAIRVAGSLLYGQSRKTWKSFQKIGLLNLSACQKDILPILKFSYYQLESPIKSCFTYCAIFPKDFVIHKELLISLWMAQGYIVPSNDGQRVEDVAEQYFTILLRRCFFQDVERDEYGGITSCKMHDLMHDIAQNIAGEEIFITTSDEVTDDKVKKARHLAFTNSQFITQYVLNETHIRSFLCVGKSSIMDQSSLKALIANWKCLRVLDLHGLGIKCLPDSIGELLHLRYLDLSDNEDLEMLPVSITKLCNLEVLNLSLCWKLKELPKDLMKLVNLRNLNIASCCKLTNMPKGISKLTCLERLSMFVINELNSCQLGELKQLESLKGDLQVVIRVDENARQVEGIRREGEYLKNKEHLSRIGIEIKGIGNDEEAGRLMEELQPHPNLKSLSLECRNKIRMSSWLSSLSNLIRLEIAGCGMEYLRLGNLCRLKYLTIFGCSNLEYITCLGNLRHLERLHIIGCSNLEYMIEKSALPLAGSSESTTCVLNGFLPHLRQIEQIHVDVDNITSNSSSMVPLALPQLEYLRIHDCPNLRCNLLCPNVERIDLYKFNKMMQIITSSPKLGDVKVEASSSSTFSSYDDVPKLRQVEVDDVAWLNSLPMETLQCVDELIIASDKNVKSLGEAAGLAFRGCSSSLKYLRIEYCSKLRSVLRGGLEHLTALEDLKIRNCPEMRLSGKEERVDDIGMPWPFLLPSLRKLRLYGLRKVKEIPNWMQSLTALQSLEIDCRNLESLPELKMKNVD